MHIIYQAFALLQDTTANLAGYIAKSQRVNREKGSAYSIYNLASTTYRVEHSAQEMRRMRRETAGHINGQRAFANVPLSNVDNAEGSNHFEYRMN